MDMDMDMDMGLQHCGDPAAHKPICLEQIASPGASRDGPSAGLLICARTVYFVSYPRKWKVLVSATIMLPALTVNGSGLGNPYVARRSCC